MTLQWTVVIEIDSRGVRELVETGSRVIVARPCGSAGPNVVWSTLKPVPRSTVSWLESYGLYASQSAVAGGTALHVQSQMHAVRSGVVYRFRGGAFSRDERPGAVPPGHYGVTNFEVRAQTFGLLQAGTVNGRACHAPINAVVLPSAMTADFVPSSDLNLWAQPGIERGTVVIDLPQYATAASFSSHDRERTFRFDRATKCFVPTQI